MTGILSACSVGVGIVGNWTMSGNETNTVDMNASGTLVATWSGSIPSFLARGSVSGDTNLPTSGTSFTVIAGEDVSFHKGGGGLGITVTISDLGGMPVDTFVT